MYNKIIYKKFDLIYSSEHYKNYQILFMRIKTYIFKINTL